MTTKRRFEADTLADELARLDEADAIRDAVVTRKRPDYSQVYRDMKSSMDRLKQEYPDIGG